MADLEMAEVVKETIKNLKQRSMEGHYAENQQQLIEILQSLLEDQMIGCGNE